MNSNLTTAPAEQILSWLEAILVFTDGQVELRAIGVPGKKSGVVSRLYLRSDLGSLVVQAVELSGRAEAVYFALNPVKPDVKRAAYDKDIGRRVLLLIDCDPTRDETARQLAGDVAKLSATEDEKAHAARMAADVAAYLARLGWPRPVRADSGNGFHLLFVIDLPNDDQSRDLVKGVLQALAHRFDTADVSIDTSVFNASRICKVPGTIARKGTPTADRPHRASAVLEIPPDFGQVQVTREMLEAVAALAPHPELAAPIAASSPIRPRDKAATGRAWTVEDRVIAYLAKCPGGVSGNKGHNQTFKTACKIGPGFDLTPDEAFRLLRDHWNPTCQPPWSEQDLRRKVDEAFKKETDRGWLLERNTAQAISTTTEAGRGGGSGDGTQPVEAGGMPDQPNEAGDDPHRLARIYLQKQRRPEGQTLLHWREEYHRWDGSFYRIAPDKEIRGELTKVIKAEFDHLNVLALRLHKSESESDKPTPVVRPVTTKKVNDVLQALGGEAMVRIVDCPEQPAWLIEDPPFPAVEVLPCRNALVHLPGLIGEEKARSAIVAPSPAFFGAYALEFDFQPNASAPQRWLSFLHEDLWPGDPASVETLQEWFGYLLTTDTSHHKILMMIGPPRSGRGTIARTLTSLLGRSNVANPTLSGLSTQFGASLLIGKPAAIFTDARISPRADISVAVERLLMISGGDQVSIPRKNREDWSGTLGTRITFISNELPRLPDGSGALLSRMIILRLTRSFEGKEDKTLDRQLGAELPGILLWAIVGWRRLRDRGRFEQPEAAADLVEQMGDLSSPVGEFVKDVCVLGPVHEIFTADLYAAWKHWCQEHGRDHPGDASGFGRNLTAAFQSVKTSTPTSRGGHKGRLYLGIDLTPEEKDHQRALGEAKRRLF